MRAGFALGALTSLALACGGGGGAAPKAAVAPSDLSATRTPYKLVVSLVVDQLSSWELRTRLPMLPNSGGFSRLVREGIYYPSVVYPHLATDTAPGHAALYTGMPAGKSGVFANEVVTATGGVASVYRDEDTRVIGSTGSDASSSAKRLRVPTVADQFRKVYPNAKIVSLSLKDRGAIPGGGAQPTLSLWFEPKTARMVTSSAFAKALPPWLEGKNAIDRDLYGQPWTLANEEWVKNNAITKDGAPGEGNMAGLGTAFPHPVTAGENFGLAFRTTPYGDAYLLSLARDAIDHEKLGEGPSFLAVSLSSHDYIGHVFGPDAWEAWDELYRLDAELGKFFAFLDSRLGADNYAVLLSSDHGITSLPELRTTIGPNCAELDPCEQQRFVGSNVRFFSEELRDSLDALLKTELSVQERLVLGVAEPYVVLTAKGKSMLALAENGAAFDRAFDKWKSAHRDLISLLPAQKLVEACAKVDQKGQISLNLLCDSVDLAGGDLFLRTRLGAIIDTGYVPGYGTNHGTDSSYDRDVPMFARAPRTWDGGKVAKTSQPVAIFSRDLRTVLGL